MTQNSPPSSGAPPNVTTETFQKHYRRGSVYPPDPSHHHGHHPPPRDQQNYSPSRHHYPPPPPLPPGYPAAPPPRHAHGYDNPSWYYRPHAAEALDLVADSDIGAAQPCRNAPPYVANKLGGVPPNLVTPKSHDSEVPPSISAAGDVNNLPLPKKPIARPPNKKSNKPKKKDSGSSNKFSSLSNNSDKEPEMEDEARVEPMKQDFHFYAMDHYDDVQRQCRQQIDQHDSIADKIKETYLLTTLLNARLIQNWEVASTSTRANYLKKEEADRKRFMSEEEIASRHCATLTARRRSPKQSGAGGIGRAASFGLGATVEVPSATIAIDILKSEEGLMKRPMVETDSDDLLETAATQLKAV